MFGAGERAAQNQRREVRPNDPQNGADGGPDKPLRLTFLTCSSKRTIGDAQDDARSSRCIRTKTGQTKRLQEESRTAQQQNKKSAEEE